MSSVDLELLAEFRTLTERAAEYRRKSYGRNRNLPRTDENRRGATAQQAPLPDRSPCGNTPQSWKDEYREWCRLYPLFTCDLGAALP